MCFVGVDMGGKVVVVEVCKLKQHGSMSTLKK